MKSKPRSTPVLDVQKVAHPAHATLGARLLARREARQLSLSALARLVKISRAYLWQLETDKADNPSRKVLEKLAAFYGEDVASLIGDNSSDDGPEVSAEEIRELAMVLPAKQRRQIRDVMVSMLSAKGGPSESPSESAQERPARPVRSRAAPIAMA